MKSVGAPYFKEHCLELLAQHDAQGLVITQDGKPIAKVIPLEPCEQEDDAVRRAALIGSLRGEVAIHGDIFSTGIRPSRYGPVGASLVDALIAVTISISVIHHFKRFGLPDIKAIGTALVLH